MTLVVTTVAPLPGHAASVTYEHDARGRVTKATYSDGTVVDYSYDANGNRTGATVTQPVDTTSPTVPGNVTATAVSSTQINLTWAASSDNVGVSGYELERCTGVGCSAFSQIGTPTATNSDGGRAPKGSQYQDQLDPAFTFLAERNVVSVELGVNLQGNGDICTSSSP